MSVRVTRVQVDDFDGELAVDVTVIRSGTYGRLGANPRPEDVPQDIRDALAVWLAGNQA